MKKLSKRALKVWLIRNFIWMVLITGGMITLLLVALFGASEEKETLLVVFYCVLPVYALLMGGLISWPFLKLKYHAYDIDDTKITIVSGVIFRSTIYVPYLQVQDAGFVQGPIQIIAKTKTIRISTAGSNQFIGQLDSEVCESILNDINPRIQARLESRNSDEALL